MASIVSPSDANHAMVEGLTNMIRTRLRERIMEKIEPDIQAAIDAAISEFQTTIETWRDPYHMRDVVKVLIERRDDPRR